MRENKTEKMPNTTKVKTRGNPNPGIPKYSRSLNSKSRGAPKVEKISRFFVKKTTPSEDQSGSSSADSPYKNCLSDIKNLNFDNSTDDFRSPNAVKQAAPVQKNKPSRKKPEKKGKVVKNPLSKFVDNNFKNVDVNPEHLQMAMALSESSYLAENPELQNKEAPQKESIDSFRQTFEKFGFGYGKTKISVENGRNNVKKNSKKSRFKYVTPILHMRTSEERENLIMNKISQILAQNDRKFEQRALNLNKMKISSEYLKELQQSRIYNLDKKSLEELNLENKFRVTGIGEQVSPPCGLLLRDWGQVAGRDRSPVKENNRLERGVSPDLFGSDEEIYVHQSKSPKMTNRETESISLHHQIASEITNAKMEGNSANTSPIQMMSDISLKTLDMVKINSPTLHISREISYKTDKIVSAINSSLDQEKMCNWNSFSDQLSRETSLEKKGSSSLSTSQATSEASQESIVISDDELNYSSFYSKTPHKRKIYYDLSHDNLEDCFTLQQSPPLDSPTKGVTSYNLTQNDNDKYLSPIKVVNAIHEDSLLQNCEEPPTANKVTFYDLTSDDYEETPLLIKLVNATPENPVLENREEPATVNDLFTDNNEKPHLSVTVEDVTSEVPVTNNGKDDNDTSILLIAEDPPCYYDYMNEDLIAYSPLPPCNNETPTEELPQNHSTFFNDSLNIILNQTDVLRQISEPFEVKQPKMKPLTPENNDFIMKTSNVTPMPNFDTMDTPRIVKELNKFGLKPLKRNRGRKLLRYIYESTHPLIGAQESEDSEDEKIVKKAKINQNEILGDFLEEEDLIFEKTQSKRIASCRIPLHIVWHNFLVANPQIRESVLLYEPLQLEVLHSMLKEQGFKFNIQDLLTFLDKKCITIRTCQGQRNSGKNKEQVT